MSVRLQLDFGSIGSRADSYRMPGHVSGNDREVFTFNQVRVRTLHHRCVFG